MRILGIDLGTKRIGVAVSDETATISGPLKCIERDSETVLCIKEILDICREMKVNKIVVGLPVCLDGSLGKRAIDSKEFCLRLKEVSGIEVVEWDERFSTKEAEDIMIKADMSRKRRKKSIDKLAAQIILQNYLDAN